MLRFLLSLVVAVVLVAVIGVVALLALGDDDDSDGGSTGAVATPARSPDASTGSNGGAPTPGGPETPDAVLQRAMDAARDITTFHFVLTHENGSIPLPLSLELEGAEGDVRVPDAMQAEVDAEAAGINVSVNVIGVDDRTWITNPFTRQWQELPDTNIRDYADPSALVAGLLPAITAESVEDGGRVDGVETQKLTGTIDSDALSDALGIAEPGRIVDVEAWIGVDDSLPRRVRLIGPLTDDEASNVVRNIEITRYGEPVEIMPPE